MAIYAILLEKTAGEIPRVNTSVDQRFDPWDFFNRANKRLQHLA